MIDPDDERTVPSRCSAPPRTGPAASVSVDDDDFDDLTIPCRRSGGGPAASSSAEASATGSAATEPAPIEPAATDRDSALPTDLDATALSARSRALSDAGPSPTQAATGSAAGGARRAAHSGDDPEDAATVVARGARRPAPAADRASGQDRGRGLPTTLAGDVPAPLGRVAQSPSAERSVYPARALPPVPAPRPGPVRREPQPFVDTGAAEAPRRRRRRWRVIAVAAAASVVIIATAILLVTLVTTG